MEWQRIRHDWSTSLSLFTFIHWRQKWQPIPVFLPGMEGPHGLPSRGSHRVGHDWSDLAAAAAVCYSKLGTRRKFFPWVAEGRKEKYPRGVCTMINWFITINTKSSANTSGKFQLCFPSIEGKIHREVWVGTQAPSWHSWPTSLMASSKTKTSVAGACLAQAWHQKATGRSTTHRCRLGVTWQLWPRYTQAISCHSAMKTLVF